MHTIMDLTYGDFASLHNTSVASNCLLWGVCFFLYRDIVSIGIDGILLSSTEDNMW